MPVDTIQHVPLPCCERMAQHRTMFTGYRERDGKVYWDLWLIISEKSIDVLSNISRCPWCGKVLRPEELRTCAFPNCPRGREFIPKSGHKQMYCSHRRASSHGAARRRKNRS